MLRYLKKHLKIIVFLYTTPPIIVVWQVPRADEVSKIVLKDVQEDFDKTYNKSYWSFFHDFFTIRGLLPHKRPLTVNPGKPRHKTIPLHVEQEHGWA